MTERTNIELAERYKALANDYLSEFVRCTGIHDKSMMWVGDEIGGIACIGDYFVDYKTIRYVVDNHISFDEFDQWYEYCNEVGMISEVLETPSIKDWFCEDYTPIAPENREHLRRLKSEFSELVEQANEKSFQPKSCEKLSGEYGKQ